MTFDTFLSVLQNCYFVYLFLQTLFFEICNIRTCETDLPRLATCWSGRLIVNRLLYTI